MMTLSEILYKVPITSVKGNPDVEISGLHTDSRNITPGSLFIAVAGTNTDGHHFINSAIENKAAAVVCEKLPDTFDDKVVYVSVKDSAEALGIMAGNFYQHPSGGLKLIGVTGTNGKTTIATILYKLFTRIGYPCGLISTVENKIIDKTFPSTHTTPDVLQLNALLKEMKTEGCTHVFMEVSSHAIHQGRISGLKFEGGIFSNITHDHLDYHKSFDEYIRVKKSFFDNLPSTAFALSNADEKRGAVMLQNTKANKKFYALKTLADYKGRVLENNLSGLVMNIDDIEVHFRLIGEFNAYNLLAVYGAAMLLGEDRHLVLTTLSQIHGAEGRFDQMISENEGVIGIVDYAHTPDALENVLNTIIKLRKGIENIITVVGCGGDRDKTKRPVMAEVAAKLSDKLILTSDNPRSEDPALIIKDMEAGLNTAGKRKTISISDRKEAIKTAVSLSKNGDIILIAGKGHEKYQEIKGVKHEFDDKKVLKEIFELMNK